MACLKAVPLRLRAVTTSKKAAETSSKSTQNVFERLPTEILVKILSHLDASALFSISHITKLFHQLASNNDLWKKLYIAELCNDKKKQNKLVNVQVSTKKIGDYAAGYWKELYLKTVAQRDMKIWKSLLGTISIHTGLPSQTEQVLRNLRVTWELTVTDKAGRESTLELSWSQFSETSLTLCWCGGDCLPNYEQISSLQLHGVRRFALSRPSLKKPGRRSLMENLDMRSLTKSTQVIGQDQLVQLKLLQPGIIIGLWRDQGSVAFIMFTLHFYKLVERSTQGSSDCSHVEPVIQPPFDDIDSEYGLHGYQLHIVLHNTVCKFMSESFSQLFCRRAHISDGFIMLTAISRTNASQHIQLSGSITMPWRCEALEGAVENCCIMSLTLLDEFRQPFICISSPVSVELEKVDVSYDYDGEHYLIHYKDSDIQSDFTASILSILWKIVKWSVKLATGP
ncbi:F-box only protein 15 isoform X2 [Girardinichthys multiradiatus]|uniref:F-box only protein 15 isoform X2 n=1 Tax=Girardinichthys multiradiatus TaxID=208333 RepID=UPI001FAB51FF|nr:F-box only protein 15 isoform X2 [Girardinichthys multiradiatus]